MKNLKLKENVNRFGMRSECCKNSVTFVKIFILLHAFFDTCVQKTQAQPFGVLVVLSVTQDFVQILILLIFMSSQEITIYNGALLPSILMVIIIFLLKITV